MKGPKKTGEDDRFFSQTPEPRNLFILYIFCPPGLDYLLPVIEIRAGAISLSLLDGCGKGLDRPLEIPGRRTIRMKKVMAYDVSEIAPKSVDDLLTHKGIDSQSKPSCATRR